MELAAPVFTVLMVCTGNICRSPGAERLLALELSQRDLSDELRVRVSSAGVRGLDAWPMDALAAEALEGRGGTSEGFVSRNLTEALADGASLIVTATKDHRSEVLQTAPRALRRTFTMKELAALLEAGGRHESASELVAAAYRRRGSVEITDYDIADPYGGTAQQHELAMSEIHDCMRVLAEALAAVTRA